MLHPPPRLPRVSGACIHNLDPDGGVITRSFPGTHIAGDAGGDQAQQQVIDAAAANKKFPVPFLIGRPAAVLTPLFRHYAGMACHSPASARPPSGVPSDAERRRATLISIAPGRQQATAPVI
jgi:hypothetical protein